MTEFIECGSAVISYDRMGIATLNYTVITTDQAAISFAGKETVTFGKTAFTGYVMNVAINPISSVTGGSNEVWIAASITLVATTDG